MGLAGKLCLFVSDLPVELTTMIAGPDVEISCCQLRQATGSDSQKAASSGWEEAESYCKGSILSCV